MSNIFKALEQAQRERSRTDLEGHDAATAGLNRSSQSTSAASEKIRDAAMADLCRAIDAQLPEGNKIVSFISAQSGEGVSFIAQHFSRLSATLLGKEVLLIKAVPDTDNPGDNVLLERDAQKIREVCCEKAVPQTQSVTSYANTPLSLSLSFCLNGFKKGGGELVDLRKYFDLVIIDAPSLDTEPYGVELTRYADGVVIVLEAEKTKAFAVENLKEKISTNSGRILGVVLNKRCFHIPDQVYSWLH